MKTGFHVGEAMTIDPVLIAPDTNLLEAAEIMSRCHVGSLIVKIKEELVGIITEQDMVRKGLAKDKKSSEIKVKEVMTMDLRCISSGQDVFEALQMMRDYNIRHLPVVDDEKLVGLITAKDILKIQPDLFAILAEKIRIKEESRKPIWTPGEKEGLCQNCGHYSQTLEDQEGILMCVRCRTESS